MKKHKLILTALVLMIAGNSNVRAQVYDTLCPKTAIWKYLDDGTSQDATSWKLASFNDATWKSGAAPLGFGDSWITTCLDPGCTLPPQIIPCTPVCLDINTTDYFRKQINITNISVMDSVFMDAQVDDGIIMYVNGNMVWSYNMPATYTSSTAASTTINGSTETVLQHKALGMTHWVTGNNIVAVELHQHGGTTSDATFAMQMRFKRDTTPVDTIKTNVHTIANKATQFFVFPNPSKGNFIIAASNPSFLNEDVNMGVYDITGRLVAWQLIHFTDTKADVVLPVNKGMYFLRLVSENTSATLKINIEN